MALTTKQKPNSTNLYLLTVKAEQGITSATAQQAIDQINDHWQDVDGRGKYTLNDLMLEGDVNLDGGFTKLVFEYSSTFRGKIKVVERVINKKQLELAFAALKTKEATRAAASSVILDGLTSYAAEKKFDRPEGTIRALVKRVENHIARCEEIVNAGGE